MEVKVEKFLIEIFCWEKGSESLRLFVIETEKFSKNLGKKKVGRSKFEWIPWSMTARILDIGVKSFQKKEFKKKSLKSDFEPSHNSWTISEKGNLL